MNFCIAVLHHRELVMCEWDNDSRVIAALYSTDFVSHLFSYFARPPDVHLCCAVSVCVKFAPCDFGL